VGALQGENTARNSSLGLFQARTPHFCSVFSGFLAEQTHMAVCCGSIYQTYAKFHCLSVFLPLEGDRKRVRWAVEMESWAKEKKVVK